MTAQNIRTNCLVDAMLLRKLIQVARKHVDASPNLLGLLNAYDAKAAKAIAREEKRLAYFERNRAERKAEAN